jgi:molecular chaperone DnaK
LNGSPRRLLAHTGVELLNDTLALVRLTEAAHRALESINTVAAVVIDIHFLTADASGPTHVNLVFTKAKINSILKSS